MLLLLVGLTPARAQYSDPDAHDAPEYADAVRNYSLSKNRDESFLNALEATLDSLSALDRASLLPETLDAHVEALQKVRRRYFKNLAPEIETCLTSYRIRAEHTGNPSWAAFLQPKCLPLVESVKNVSEAPAAIRKWLLEQLKPLSNDSLEEAAVLGLKFDLDPLSVWKGKNGNALERNLLFVACLRSVGIPSRLVVCPISQKGTLGFSYVEFWEGAHWGPVSLEDRKDFSAPVGISQGSLVETPGSTCWMSFCTSGGGGVPPGAQVYVIANDALFPIAGRDIYVNPDFSSLKLPPGAYWVQCGDRTTGVVSLKKVVLQEGQRLLVEYDPKTALISERAAATTENMPDSVAETPVAAGIEFDLLQEGVELYNLQVRMKFHKGLEGGGVATVVRLLHSDKPATVLLALKFLDSLAQPKQPMSPEFIAPLRQLTGSNDPEITALARKLSGGRVEDGQLMKPVAGLETADALAVIEKRVADPNRTPFTSDIDAVVNACRSDDPKTVIRALQMFQKYSSLRRLTTLLTVRPTLEKLSASPDPAISAMAKELLAPPKAKPKKPKK